MCRLGGDCPGVHYEFWSKIIIAKTFGVIILLEIIRQTITQHTTETVAVELNCSFRVGSLESRTRRYSTLVRTPPEAIFSLFENNQRINIGSLVLFNLIDTASFWLLIITLVSWQ